ncbi:hypothetical protein GGH95_001819 [Coemansia sp. RSA 1836]|nr:hypothetical protein GGH95_001819 [Coemansia sp. RSA 1836]
MSLFRNNQRNTAAAGASHSFEPDFSNPHNPTYYDVLKCHGEFSEPSVFFSRPLKATHSSSSAYPWATDISGSSVVGGEGDVVGTPSANTDTSSKHRLRRAFTSSDQSTQGRGSGFTSSSSSSSGFPQVLSDGSLPSSVFRLPTAAGSSSSSSRSDTSGGMTFGGRALRKANQVKMSVFDHKVSLF